MGLPMKFWRSEGHAGGWLLATIASALLLKYSSSAMGLLPDAAKDLAANSPTTFWAVYWSGMLGIGRLLARQGSAESLVQHSNLKGKIAIVTGTNYGGIGFYTAMKIAETGCKVIITCRSEKLMKETAIRLQQESSAGGCTTPLDLVADMPPLVLDDFGGIQVFAETFKKRFDRLDILVNNAGMASTKDAHYSSSFPKYEIHTAVNFLGPVVLTEALIPLLQKSGGRVVNVASDAHGAVKNFNIDLLKDLVALNKGQEKASGKLVGGIPFKRYGISKLCNLHYSTYVLLHHGVPSCALHPGVVATSIFGRNVPDFVWVVLSKFFLAFMKTCPEGAQTSIHCALCPQAELLAKATSTTQGLPMARFYADCRNVTFSCSKDGQNAREGGKMIDWGLEELKALGYVKK